MVFKHTRFNKISFRIYLYIIYSKACISAFLDIKLQSSSFIAVFDCDLVKFTEQFTENYNILQERIWEGSYILAAINIELPVN